MSTARLDQLIWVLILGGLLAVGLGIAVTRQGGEWGAVLVAVGSAAAAVGVLLIWVRSRRGPPADPTEGER